MGGPMQKQMANAMPTCARAFERFAAVVTSERMALTQIKNVLLGENMHEQCVGRTLRVARFLHSDHQ